MSDINQANRFKTGNEEQETPDIIFGPLDREFGFTLDVAASETNAKCKRYFSKSEDGLKQKWEGICWMNPPYGQKIKQWIRKAYESSLNGATVVCLLPVRSNTNYWHDYCMKGEIRFIRGYPKFKGHKQGLKMPLAIVENIQR